MVECSIVTRAWGSSRGGEDRVVTPTSCPHGVIIVLHLPKPTVVHEGVKVLVGQHTWLAGPPAFKAGEPGFCSAQRVRTKQCHSCAHRQAHLIDKDALNLIQTCLRPWQPRRAGVVARCSGSSAVPGLRRACSAVVNRCAYAGVSNTASILPSKGAGWNS